MGQVQNYLPEIPPFSKCLPMFSLIEGRKNSPTVAIKSTQKDSDPNPSVVCGVVEKFPYHQAVLRHQLGVLQFNPILTPATQRQHQIPKGQGLVLPDCPLPKFRYQSCVRIVMWASDPQARDWRFLQPRP